MRDGFDLEEPKEKQEPWEYVAMEPPVPTVQAGPTAEEWRKLTEAQKLAMIAERDK